MGSNSRQEHRKPAKQEMSHNMATFCVKPWPAHMDTPLARAIPVQLAHSAARPHTGGKRRGRHTSVTTGAGDRERQGSNEQGKPGQEISITFNQNPHGEQEPGSVSSSSSY